MTPNPYTIPCGLSLLGVGLFLRYRIGRRRFRRRNVAGLQQFSSYGRALWVTFTEHTGLWIANLCITAGGCLLAAALFHPDRSRL